jgi:fatty-acyl-CoA synthase
VDIGSGGRHKAVASWARALGNIAPLERGSDRTLPAMLDALAETHGPRNALESEHDSVTYAGLAQRCSQYARWALAQGVQAGDVVCLLMPNCVEFVAIWLGITRVGGVVALINTNLVGDALRHSVAVVAPRHVVAAAEFMPALAAVRDQLPTRIDFWVYGGSPAHGAPWSTLDRALYAATPLEAAERRQVLARETALLIFTSGTTGLPKAAKISHYRVLEWSFWFAGMMDTGPADRLYNCLPLYHSTGGVAGLGAVLVNGGTVVIRTRFSARRFWDDVVAQGCTLFLYIGELCRYLVTLPPHPLETQHRLRLCCGNGLRADIWEPFENRFRVPRILEFYASTEGNVALYNCEGKVGAIGRVPSFLAHRFPVALIECDTETGELRRGADGFCVRCGADVVGEAIGKIVADDHAGPRQFEGYTEGAATERKVLRDVFEAGDAWFRTGDLMRRDGAGFFYFVDRLGDTFRWKGENVSTTQVAEAVCACSGVTGAAVYGVAVPGTEGRACMATITVDADFDPAALRAELMARLPAYARPLFLRVRDALETTGTFKPVKARLVAQGYMPDGDRVYIDAPEGGGYRAMDDAMIADIQAGAVRL